MRLEIVVPDNTRPDLLKRLSVLAQTLTDRPELVEEIYLRDDSDEGIQKLFTPHLLAEIDQADAEISAGNFRTLDQLDSRLAATKSAWLTNHHA